MKKSSLKKILIDWRKVLPKIVMPNQFPGLLHYVGKLARVSATWVKNLQMMYSSVSCVIEFLHGWSKLEQFRLWNFKFGHPKLVRSLHENTVVCILVGMKSFPRF